MKFIDLYEEAGVFKGFRYSVRFDEHTKIFHGVIFTSHLITFQTTNVGDIIMMLDYGVNQEFFFREIVSWRRKKRA